MIIIYIAVALLFAQLFGRWLDNCSPPKQWDFMDYVFSEVGFPILVGLVLIYFFV